MKQCSKTVVLIFISFLIGNPAIAQIENATYTERISLGFGGENGFLGVDYSHDIYRSKIFLGLGCGLGTGWTGYFNYEPVKWKGLSPFVSTGISYTLNGTIILSPGASVFWGSGGLNYAPRQKWKVLPCLRIGMTNYSLLSGDAEGGMNGWGPLIKLGITFPGRRKATYDQNKCSRFPGTQSLRQT